MLIFTVFFCLTTLSLVGAAPTTTASGLIYYNAQYDFTDAFPNLTVEDFEAGSIPNDSSAVFAGPLSSETSNSIFSHGDIAAGVTITTVTSTGSLNLAILGGDYSTFGNTSKAIQTNYPSDNFQIVFSGSGVNAFGMDLLFRAISATATITLYGEGNVLLETIAPTVGITPMFVGFYSMEPITRITIENNSRYEIIDNLRFGQIQNDATFYSNRAIFESTYPGLQTEDFEESTVSPGTISTFASPLNKSTDGPGGFSTGDIAEDLHLSSLDATIPSSELSIVGSNYGIPPMNNPSNVLCHGPGGRDLHLRLYDQKSSGYDIDTYVVGMDLWQFAPSTQPTTQAIVSIYELTGKFIGATSVTVTAGQSNFIGFFSRRVVEKVTVQFVATGGVNECVDNIQYGSIPDSSFALFKNEVNFVQTRSNLPKEDFSESPVPDTASVYCNAPITADTNQAGCFAAGDILPGISFRNPSHPDGLCYSCVLLYGKNTGAFNNTTPMLTLTGLDEYEITFTADNVHYVGLNSHIALFSMYGADDTMIGTVVHYPASPPLQFIGIKSGAPIKRIVFRGAAFINEITFGPKFPWSMYLPAIKPAN